MRQDKIDGAILEKPPIPIAVLQEIAGEAHVHSPQAKQHESNDPHVTPPLQQPDENRCMFWAECC